MTYRITVDTGGTFTDVVVGTPEGEHIIGKALTTPRVYEGFSKALAMAAEILGLRVPDILAATDMVIYGTTRATNAIVEFKTARTALLTTRGFPDILLLREGGKTRAYDYTRDYPRPYVARADTFEVGGRIDARGRILTPLDEGDVAEAIERLKSHGYEAAAVCLLWSVANPAHELKVEALLAQALPDLPTTLSHRVAPIIREYRRASAAAIDASLKPLMQEHLEQLEADLRKAGLGGLLFVSTSVGGCVDIQVAAAAPIHTVKSGPSMAPVAARAVAHIEQLPDDIIVCDTGGTTFDVGLIRGGDIVHTRETWLGERLAGQLVATSTVDIRSVGAGGGSIAYIDAGGLLQVGPRSAGSRPGPACYGLGGLQATVTDAGVALGFIAPDGFLGGRMRLDSAAAATAVDAVARPLNRTTQRAAWAILQIANETMIKAVNEITVAEGFDPAESLLVAGGGAAGLNIVPIAVDLGIRHVLIPRSAAALSAVGMQYADIVSEEGASFVTSSREFDPAGANAALAAITARLESFAARFESLPRRSIRYTYRVEARYATQIWELDVPLPASRFTCADDVAALTEAFHRAHERVYAVRDASSEVEYLNWRGRVSIDLVRPPAQRARAREPAGAQASRSCCFGGEPVQTPVHRGSRLAPGAVIAGPAIIEEDTTTLVVYPSSSARVTQAGNYLIDTHAGSRT